MPICGTVEFNMKLNIHTQLDQPFEHEIYRMKLINSQVTKVSWAHKGGHIREDKLGTGHRTASAQTVTTWSTTNAGQNTTVST